MITFILFSDANVSNEHMPQSLPPSMVTCLTLRLWLRRNLLRDIPGLRSLAAPKRKSQAS